MTSTANPLQHVKPVIAALPAFNVVRVPCECYVGVVERGIGHALFAESLLPLVDFFAPALPSGFCDAFLPSVRQGSDCFNLAASFVYREHQFFLSSL
jgi:hypothetical protein